MVRPHAWDVPLSTPGHLSYLHVGRYPGTRPASGHYLAQGMHACTLARLQHANRPYPPGGRTIRPWPLNTCSWLVQLPVRAMMSRRFQWSDHRDLTMSRVCDDHDPGMVSGYLPGMQTTLNQKRIAELNATYPKQHGATCGACGKAWRVWYDASDRVVGRVKCKCE